MLADRYCGGHEVIDYKATTALPSHPADAFATLHLLPTARRWWSKQPIARSPNNVTPTTAATRRRCSGSTRPINWSVGEAVMAAFTAQTHDLLSHLWRGGSWAYWWTPDGPWYFSKKYQEMHRARESLWFPLNRPWPQRLFWCPPHGDCGATLAVGQDCYRGRRQRRVRRIRHRQGYDSKLAIWSHLDTLPLYPTCVIDSGGGLHCYWFIEQPQPVTDDKRAYLKRCQAA